MYNRNLRVRIRRKCIYYPGPKINQHVGEAICLYNVHGPLLWTEGYSGHTAYRGLALAFLLL